MTIVQKINQLLIAIENCRKSGNEEWGLKHAAELTRVTRLLPSGSGFDAGTHLMRELSSPKLIAFEASFHHMNDAGQYDGWTNHVIRVRPAFNGLTISVSGPDRNGIKDYIWETFDACLNAEFTE